MQNLRSPLQSLNEKVCECWATLLVCHFLGQMPNFGKNSNRYETKYVPKEPPLKVRARTRVWSLYLNPVEFYGRKTCFWPCLYIKKIMIRCYILVGTTKNELFAGANNLIINLSFLNARSGGLVFKIIDHVFTVADNRVMTIYSAVLEGFTLLTYWKVTH